MVKDDRDLPTGGYFAGPEHRFPLRVFFEDTDLSGMVYHANYLRYLERARSDMLRTAGIGQRAAHDGGEGVYAVSEVAIRYRRPARLDDALLVSSEVSRIRAARCVIRQKVTRDGELLADAEVIAVFLSPDGRPKRQPRAWIEIFERLKRDD